MVLYWDLFQSFGFKFLFGSFAVCAAIMFAPFVLTSDVPSLGSIALDILAGGALFFFLGLQLFIRELYRQWAEGASGLLPSWLNKLLLVTNTIAVVAIVSGALAALTYNLAHFIRRSLARAVIGGDEAVGLA
jgi:hypothetical protein